jgi:hypothetical protein
VSQEQKNNEQVVLTGEGIVVTGDAYDYLLLTREGIPCVLHEAVDYAEGEEPCVLCDGPHPQDPILARLMKAGAENKILFIAQDAPESGAFGESPYFDAVYLSARGIDVGIVNLIGIEHGTCAPLTRYLNLYGFDSMACALVWPERLADHLIAQMDPASPDETIMEQLLSVAYLLVSYGNPTSEKYVQSLAAASGMSEQSVRSVMAGIAQEIAEHDCGR